MPVRLDLPPRGVLKPNDADDPLPYYYHPWVGWLYRHRLQMGLDFLPAGGKRVLEIGVGSGVLVPTLTKHYAEYTGTDLTLAPGLDALVAPGCRAEFRRADLLADADLPAAHFDAIVCFSVLEHIRDADGAARGLCPRTGPGRHAGDRLPDGEPPHDPRLRRHRLRPHRRPPRQPPGPNRRGARRGADARPSRRLPAAAPVPAALYQCTAWTTRSND